MILGIHDPFSASLSGSLLKEGYSVIDFETAESALDYMSQKPDIDLILSPLTLTDTPDLDFCSELRTISNVPLVLFYDTDSASVRFDAYHNGADECIETTLSPEEILVKIQAHIRRFKEYRGKNIIIRALEINREARTVMKNNRRIDLTDLELNILEYLMDQNGNIVSIPEIYENVWGEKYFPGSNNAVMVHILNLRKKIEDNVSHPKIIRTVWGKGYRLCL